MAQKNNLFYYYFILNILLILTSCSKEKGNPEKVDLQIIELNYNFHNYISNVRDKSNSPIIKERNYLEIKVNQKGECKIKGKIVNDSLIVSELKKYITPNPINDKMPITVEKEFYHSGKVLVTKQLLIVAFYDKKLSYEKYAEIRNKVYISYSEVKNDFAKLKFKKGINQLLNSDNQNDLLKGEEINFIFPILYTEVINE